MPKLFQLNHGGDATNNAMWTLYPQNVGAITKVTTKGTPLRIAAHHGPGTHLITREIALGDRMNQANPGVRAFFEDLASAGEWPETGDLIGLVTIPHASLVRTVQFQNCCAIEGVKGQLVRVSNGALLLDAVDLSEAPNAMIVELERNSFITPYGENDVIAFQIKSWPPLTTPADGPACLEGCYNGCEPVLGMCFSVTAEVFKGIDDDCPSCRGVIR